MLGSSGVGGSDSVRGPRVAHREFLVSPKPYTQWTKSHQNAAFPLLMMFSVGFSLEMYVTYFHHLSMFLTSDIKDNSFRRYLPILGIAIIRLIDLRKSFASGCSL